ncbi:MAG: hypothetical protein HGA44_15825 [Cellulomonadaceae bacterium]|nr:hypothetical protein [Cellulomonadaceae bacterium]
MAPSPLVPPASLAPVVAPAEPAPTDEVAVSPPSADVHDPEPGRRSGRRAAASPGVTLDDATPPFGTPQVFVPVAVPVDEPSAPARAVPDLPYAFTGALPAASLRPEPDARLVDLARRGGSVALVWTRARRGVTHEAVLLADGTIQAPDGQTYADPSTAAERIVDAQVPVDGWRVWHVGSATGPTLAEACSAQPQP